MVRLYPDDGSGQMTVAVMKDDGTFRISGPGFAPGRYLWDVTNLADSIYVKSVRYDSVDVTRSPINVLAGGRLEIVLSGKTSSITGTLHNDKNRPLNGVTVTVWAKNPNPGSPSSVVSPEHRSGQLQDRRSHTAMTTSPPGKERQPIRV